MSRNDPGLPRLAVSVSLSLALDRWLRAQAQRLGLSHGAYIRLVLEQRREQEPERHDEKHDDDLRSSGSPKSPVPGAQADGTAMSRECWAHCAACDRDFLLGVVVPCPPAAYVTALKAARCPQCGTGKGLTVYEPGRQRGQLAITVTQT